MPDGQDPSHPISVPDKPALEGLEAKWTPRWEERRRLPVRSLAARAPRCSRSTRRRRRSAGRCTSGTCSPTPTPTSSRAFSGCAAGPSSIRWAGTTTGCRPNAGCRTTSACAASRRCPYDPAFVPPEKPGKQPVPVSRPNFIELCARLTAEDEKVFEHLWRHSGPVGRLVDDLRDHRSPGAAGVAAGVPAAAATASLAYQLEAPTLWDIDFRTAVAQAELEDREQPGAYHRIRFARADRGGFVEIETTRPELIPACVALVAHPDDERYQPLFGNERARRRCSACAVPVRPHPLADPEKGSGIAMICTFGDVTDVVWWRELSLPVRAIIQANGALRPLTWGEPGWESVDAAAAQQPLRRARRPLRRQGPHPDRRAAARDRRSHRRAATDHARGQVLREGRSAARDHHQPAVVHQDDGVPRAAAPARRGAALASRLHAGQARELDQRVEHRLVRQPAAVLRRAVPGLVPRARGRQRRSRRPSPAA